MTTSLEAYESYLIKANRNDSNSNIHLPRGKFVIVFNEQARKWMKNKFRRKLSSSELDELSDLLVDDFELKKIGANRDNVDFELPEDFYNMASSTSIVTRKECERVIDNWEAKSHNIRVLLTDENNRPSFDFEETPLIIANNKIKIYFDDFFIKNAFLSYYKFPDPIDLEGYIKVDGSRSENIDPKLNDMAVDEIVNRCVIETTRNSQNPDAFPFAKDRITTEEEEKK